jgi:hypothetical protein
MRCVTGPVGFHRYSVQGVDVWYSQRVVTGTRTKREDERCVSLEARAVGGRRDLIERMRSVVPPVKRKGERP